MINVPFRYFLFYLWAPSVIYFESSPLN